MFAILAAVAMPQAIASDFRPHGLSVGLGNHNGWFGVGYTLRGQHWGVHGGLGVNGWALQGRYHPFGWRPLYVSGGLSPLIVDRWSGSTYGPDLGVGLEFSASRIGMNVGLGLGFVAEGFDETTSVGTIDVALCVNIGKRRDKNGPVDPSPGVEDDGEDDVSSEAEVDLESMEDLQAQAALEAARVAFEAAEAALQEAEAAVGTDEEIEVEEEIEEEKAPPTTVIRPASDDDE